MVMEILKVTTRLAMLAGCVVGVLAKDPYLLGFSALWVVCGEIEKLRDELRGQQ